MTDQPSGPRAAQIQAQTLRDDERSSAWRRKAGVPLTALDWIACNCAADYLEAVGPDGTAESGEAICANSVYAHGPHQWAELRTCPGWPTAAEAPKLGVTVDEATLTRAMTAGIDEPTFRRESLGEWPIRVVPGLPDDRVLFVTPPCPDGCDHTHAVALDLSAPDDRATAAETGQDGADSPAGHTGSGEVVITREELTAHIDDPVCTCARCHPEWHTGERCNCPHCQRLRLPTAAETGQDGTGQGQKLTEEAADG